MRNTILNLKRKGRYYLGFGIAFLMISMVFSTIGIAEENTNLERLNYEFLFSEPVLSSSSLLNTEFTDVTIKGCIQMG